MSKLASILGVVLAVAGASIASAQGEASINGTVKLDGAPKKAKKLNSQLDGDKFCAAQRADQDVFSEDLVVGDGNALANALVWVKTGAKGPFKTPGEAAVIDQVKCVYKPHVVVVQVGQKLTIKNSDETMHNIHSVPKI